VNHVPDAVLAALDDFGYGLLTGQPATVDERLRRDLRLRITCDHAAIGDGTAPMEFRIQYTSALARVREHGSYVCTIVDNVESRLRAWGLEPPPAYDHRTTADGWQVYAGGLTLRVAP
jgi:hypothetical protein